MKLLVKTPFRNKNKYLPHFLEHCVLYSKDSEKFLYLSDIYAYTCTGYTGYEWEKYPLDTILAYLQAPIPVENLLVQKKVIKKELSSPTFWQKLYEKSIQKAFDKELVTNGVEEIPFEELIEYHTTWYQERNMLLVDDHWDLDMQRWKMKDITHHIPFIDEFQEPEYFKISYQKEITHLLAFKNVNPSSILITDFFWALCSDLCYFEDTRKGRYFKEKIDSSLTDMGFLLSREDDFPKLSKQKWKEFFEFFKPYYCKRIAVGGKRDYIAQIALFYDVFISKEDHQKLIHSLDFSLIEKLAVHFKLLN